MKKTAIYIRVSTDKQVDGDSIPAQRNALRKYIDDHADMIFAGEYMDDGVSGTKYSERDELQRLLDDVKKGQVDLILITKLDRWFRSVRHYTATQEILDRHGVGWLAIWEPIYDTTTPQGRLIVNQMMSIAQFEAEQTGQRIRQVQAYKVMQGEVLSGTPPHGYKIVDKHLVPNEYAGNVITVFDTYERTSSIAQTMRETAHLEDVPRSQYNMKKMLQSRFYIGEHRGNKNFCPPLVDRKVWEHVQFLLGKNIKKSQCHTYIFSGLIRCKDCGGAYVAYTCHWRDSKRETTYSRYRCSKHYLRNPAQCNNSKTAGEKGIESFLLDNISDLVGNVLISYEESTKESDKTERQIKSIESKIDKLKELYINDLISIDEYKEDKAVYLSCIADLKEKAGKPPQTDLNALRQLNNKDFRVIYEGFTKEERRRFWRGIIKEIRHGSDKTIEVDFL